MEKFTCVTNNRTVERKASSVEEAAEQVAKAIHTAYWPEFYRNGTDNHGTYSEYTLMAGKRAEDAVRIYTEYKP
jgi:hypothetical protein